MTYQMSAIAASLGVTSLAVAAVYCRFSWHMDGSDGTFPWADAAATLLLTIGGAVSAGCRGAPAFGRLSMRPSWAPQSPSGRLGHAACVLLTCTHAC